MENTNLKGAVEAVDISDLRTAPERTELGLRKRAENSLSAINGQVLPICSAGNKEANSKEPPKWTLPSGASQEQLVLPRVPVEPVTAQTCSKSAPRVSQGSQQQVEMDIKIMLVPENMENKAALKHQNDETRLPLLTKKKSAPGWNCLFSVKYRRKSLQSLRRVVLALCVPSEGAARTRVPRCVREVKERLPPKNHRQNDSGGRKLKPECSPDCIRVCSESFRGCLSS